MTTIDPERLLLLLNWMSPAFPTGSFAYSHGLEYAISSSVVSDAESLECWIGELLRHGSGWNDAVLMAALTADNREDINKLALSLCSSRERYLESTALAASFALGAGAFVELDLTDGDHAYPIVVAAAGLAAGMEREALLLAHLQSFCASLVSVAVRLVPVGQRAGLTVLANLIPLIARTARLAAASTPDDLGSSALFSDIASMRHECQETRIFRS